MDFKKILEHFADAETAVTKQNAQLNEAAFAKSGVKADAKKHKADATTRKQYFVKLTNAKGGNKGVTVMADEGESEGEVRSRVARDHKSQGWTVSSIREKGDAAEKAAVEKKSSVTASGKKRGRPPGSTKKVTEGRQTVSEYIAEARLMEKSMSPEQKGERERIVKGMKKVKGDFEKRYPGRGEEVMYATATKRAMKESQQGVAEGHADQQRKIFKKNGQPVGEVGIDRESSPGVGQWYMKCYAYDIDNSGYDSYEEAVAELKHCLKQGVAEGLNEMDKSAPQPGRDGKVSHSTYGSRDKKGSDYFKGKEAPGKPITKKQMEKDALDILKKQGVAEGLECNHTEEGKECPVHGLDECGTYMEESQFDEDLSQMKKIAGVGALAAAGLGAHISGENAEIRAKEVEKLEKQVASEPNSVKRGQLEKMIKDIKAGKPLSKGDIISEVNPHHYDSDVDYYDAVEAERARLRGDHDDAEDAHYAAQADQKAYDDDMFEDASDEAEYSDEVGMVDNNLETIERAAEELESILQQGEDLPEWVEEKVSNAKAMLVSAKEYMASQHANGDVHHVDDEEMDEGNEFSGELAKAKASGAKEFEVDGKTYPVKESRSAIDELAECYDMAYQQAQAEPEQPGRMTVSANTSTEGTRSLTVNAEGDMADELAQLLSLSGLAGGHGHQEEMDEGAADEFHANTKPEPATFSLHRLLDAGDDLNAPKDQHPAAAARGDNPLTR